MFAKIVGGLGLIVLIFTLGLVLRCLIGAGLGWLAAAITGITQLGGMPMTSAGVIIALFSLLWTVDITASASRE